MKENQMPKLKLIANQLDRRAGAGYVRYIKGDVFDVDAKTAKRLIDAKAAVLAEEPKATATLEGESDPTGQTPASDRKRKS